MDSAKSVQVDQTALVDQTTLTSGFLPGHVIHLHPTRLCNLACLHCYSESDQQHNTGLDGDMLCNALAVLRSEGYDQISVSGGEPLVYQPLHDVVNYARQLGFRLTMITNGLLVNKRIDPLLSLFDGIAVSFDGLAETHNAMRGRTDAFDRACRALKHLADMGRPVSAAISLTRTAIPELPDLADHLVNLGACVLQVRPVARAGRARGLNTDSFFNDADQARLYLVVMALQQELADGVRVHCDLAPAQGLWRQRDAYAGLLADCSDFSGEERLLATMVNPLVISDSGVLKPIAYDFASRFDIARIDRLSIINLHRYKQERLDNLRLLVGNALQGLRKKSGLVDWFDHCTRLSEAQSIINERPIKFMPISTTLPRPNH